MWSLAEERGMLRHECAFEKFADINEVLCLAPKWHGVYIVNSLLLFLFVCFNHFTLVFVVLCCKASTAFCWPQTPRASVFFCFFFVPLCLVPCLHFVVAVMYWLCSANPIMKQ